ncbi:MAG TPA: GNAT family N-acetyltransferase [Opitutaceae bacterium]|nr:GNAT family N-acetyltransferase [Opitutaceae bacterium]
MKGNAADIVVRHNVGENRFEAEVEGTLSVADYQIREGEMVMTHTYVPPEMRGRGIAEKLVRAALEHARHEKLRVVPACSYVDDYIQRHPEFQALVG